jgi:hypothetical protein
MTHAATRTITILNRKAPDKTMIYTNATEKRPGRLDKISDVDLSWIDADWIQNNGYSEIESTLDCCLDLLDSFIADMDLITTYKSSRQEEGSTWVTPYDATGDYDDHLLMKSLPVLQAELQGAEGCFLYLRETVLHKETIDHEDHTWNEHNHINCDYEYSAALVKHVTIELDDDMGRQGQCKTDSQCEPISVSRFQYYQENPERDKIYQAITFANDGNSDFEIPVSTMEYYHENPQRDKIQLGDSFASLNGTVSAMHNARAVVTP